MMKQNNYMNNNHSNNDFGKQHDDFDWNKYDDFEWNKQHNFDFDWCDSSYPYYPCYPYPYPDSGCWEYPYGCEYPYPYESEDHFMDMGGF